MKQIRTKNNIKIYAETIFPINETDKKDIKTTISERFHNDIDRMKNWKAVMYSIDDGDTVVKFHPIDKNYNNVLALAGYFLTKPEDYKEFSLNSFFETIIMAINTSVINIIDRYNKI